ARAAQQERRKGVDLMFEDAIGTLKKAIELDDGPVPPRQLLAEAWFELGDDAAAARSASELLLHCQSLGGGKPEELDAAHRLRARAAARQLAQLAQEHKDDSQLLADARTSFRQLEQRGQLDDGLRGLWADMEGRAGAAREAVLVYARAL